MDVIKGVLKEELKNSLHMKKGYEKELSKLPNGSLVKKKRKGHYYYYLVLREKGKVRCVYKGKISQEEIGKYEKIKRIRAKYRELLSKVKRQIKFLKKVLNEK